MQTLKKQFEDAKAELNINIDDRNKAERLLEAEKSEHEKLKEDLEFLQGTTIGSEEDTERKIKAMEVEIPHRLNFPNKTLNRCRLEHRL